MSSKACFVGGGNMASAILQSSGVKENWQTNEIWIADPVEEIRQRLDKDGYNTVAEPARLPEAQACFLCTKPQHLRQACQSLISGEALAKDTAIISIAAGITIAQLREWTGAQLIVRTMPNTPLQVGKGCTFACTDQDRSSTAGKTAELVFSSCGSFYWLADEGLLDAVTALSGSGPAYAYLLIETMAATGKAMGLPADVSLAAAADTLAGASAMVKASDVGPDVLRERVTSTGGTTAAALEILSEKGFASALEKAMQAAKKRSEELSSAS